MFILVGVVFEIKLDSEDFNETASTLELRTTGSVLQISVYIHLLKRFYSSHLDIIITKKHYFHQIQIITLPDELQIEL